MTGLTVGVIGVVDLGSLDVLDVVVVIGWEVVVLVVVGGLVVKSKIKHCTHEIKSFIPSKH